MRRIQKLVLEVQQVAEERGHNPASVVYAGRSLLKRGEHAVIMCESCSASASVRSKPYPDECDIEGTLTKTSCNVATMIRDNLAAYDKSGRNPYARACANLIPA